MKTENTRRDCSEIRGIPLPEEPSEEDTNDIVIHLSQKIGLMDLMEGNDISVSHRVPSARDLVEPAIIVTFVRREMRENFCRARKRLKSVSTADLGFSEAKKIYIHKSLTQKNKELFKGYVNSRKITVTSSCGLMLERFSLEEMLTPRRYLSILCGHSFFLRDKCKRNPFEL